MQLPQGTVPVWETWHDLVLCRSVWCLCRPWVRTMLPPDHENLMFHVSTVRFTERPRALRTNGASMLPWRRRTPQLGRSLRHLTSLGLRRGVSCAERNRKQDHAAREVEQPFVAHSICTTDQGPSPGLSTSLGSCWMFARFTGP